MAGIGAHEAGTHKKHCNSKHVLRLVRAALPKQEGGCSVWEACVGLGVVEGVQIGVDVLLLRLSRTLKSLFAP